MELGRIILHVWENCLRKQLINFSRANEW